MPLGLLVTHPDPVPVLLTVSRNVGGGGDWNKRRAAAGAGLLCSAATMRMLMASSSSSRPSDVHGLLSD
jgi:hypothetical protein